MERWSLEADYFTACNCDWGCPCNFNARPTEGRCMGGEPDNDFNAEIAWATSLSPALCAACLADVVCTHGAPPLGALSAGCAGSARPRPAHDQLPSPECDHAVPLGHSLLDEPMAAWH